MKLNNAVLSQSLPGYALPQYDRQAMARRSRQQPTWLHFGAGNLFRAFPAVLAQRLLNAGETDTGVLCCEAYDTDAVTQFLRPYDDLTLSVSLLADGSMEKEVVGSIAQSLTLPQDRCRVEEIFRAPSLQMVSFTITEKGYAVNAAVKEDMGRAPREAQTLLGALAACCLARFEACGAPLALVSMDNCSQNGEKLREGFFAVLDAWNAAGHVSPEAYAWAQEKLSFPWSMIDKITPRPHESVQKALAADGWEGMDIQVTGKNTYIAPFVNTEKPQYLVIEDDFPAGRPPLEKAGVLFTSRDTVNAVERMKVCTCLNPLHTALAIFGCLLGHTSIAGEMADPDLRDFVTTMAVFLMLFLFIAIVCFAAVLVIGYTRCLTIALNNRQVFEDLRRLGATPHYLYQVVRGQVSRVFFVPGLTGTTLIYAFYMLILYFNGDPLGFSAGELAGMGNCLLLVAALSLLLYGFYRFTLGHVCRMVGVDPASRKRDGRRLAAGK